MTSTMSIDHRSPTPPAGSPVPGRPPGPLAPPAGAPVAQAGSALAADAALPPMPPAPPSLPMLPALPTLPPAAPPTPHVATPVAEAAVPLEVGGIAAAHRATSARRRRRSPWWHTVVRAFIVLALVGGIVTGVVNAYQRLQATELPEFPDATRPEYGSVTVRYEARSEEANVVGTVNADAAGRQWELVIDKGAEGFNIQTDGSWMWVRAGDEWVSAGAPDGADRVAAAARLLMFDDVVPTAAREFFELRSEERIDTGDRAVTRFELDVRRADFSAASPVAYASWPGATEEAAGTPAVGRLVIEVDDAGVVWSLLSTAADSVEQVALSLVEYGDSPFTVPMPPVFWDTLTVDLYVEGRPLDCETDRRTLEVVVEAYAAAFGTPPVSETQTIPEFLRRDLLTFDIVDGVVVPNWMCE